MRWWLTVVATFRVQAFIPGLAYCLSDILLSQHPKTTACSTESISLGAFKGPDFRRKQMPPSWHRAGMDKVCQRAKGIPHHQRTSDMHIHTGEASELRTSILIGFRIPSLGLNTRSEIAVWIWSRYGRFDPHMVVGWLLHSSNRSHI